MRNMFSASAVILTISQLLLFTADAAARRPETNTGENLSKEDLQLILNQAEASANRVASGDGLRTNTVAERGPVVKRPVKMHIAIVDRGGKLVALRSMSDAWEGSKDIAISKARTAAFFSSDENALTSRIVGELTQITTGTDGKMATGPLWGIGNSNQQGSSGGKETRNGIITFPGGLALYKNGRLAGGIGVSGDGVDQDEAVAFGGASGFEPGPNAVKLGYKAPVVPAVENPR